METQTINQPMFVVALSERELKAALDDATPLQTALRRQWLESKGDAPLQLAAPAAAKMGGGKTKVAKPAGKAAGKKSHKANGVGEFPCPHCDAVRKTQGFLDRHIRQVHAAIQVDADTDDDE